MKKIKFYFSLFTVLFSCSSQQEQTFTLMAPQSAQKYTQPLIEQYAESQSINIKQNYVSGTGAVLSNLKMEKINPRTDIVLFLNETQSRDIASEYSIVRKELLDTGFLAIITRDGVQIKSLADLLNIADKFAWINPQSSSPGRDFLLWTYACMNEEQWMQYWSQIRQKAKFFADGWSQAYDWYSQGLVQGMVSYHTDKAYNIYNNTGVDSRVNILEEGWVKQNEYALLLKDTPTGQNIMDFLISEEYQNVLPTGNWTLPANPNIDLPDVFTQYVPSITRGDKVFNPGIYSEEEVKDILAKWQDIWQKNL